MSLSEGGGAFSEIDKADWAKDERIRIGFNARSRAVNEGKSTAFEKQRFLGGDWGQKQGRVGKRGDYL